MSTSPFINPATDSRRAYEALLAGLYHMCSYEPLGYAEQGTDMPELLPAPKAAARLDGGHTRLIALTAQQDYESLPGQQWTITRGDTLVIDPEAKYGLGDTLFVADTNNEFTLIGIREDGSFCWQVDVRDDYVPRDSLVVGPVVEVRKGRALRTEKPTKRAAPDTSLLLKVLQELGSRDKDDWLPELLPAPLAVSRCDEDSGQ